MSWLSSPSTLRENDPVKNQTCKVGLLDAYFTQREALETPCCYADLFQKSKREKEGRKGGESQPAKAWDLSQLLDTLEILHETIIPQKNTTSSSSTMSSQLHCDPTSSVMSGQLHCDPMSSAMTHQLHCEKPDRVLNDRPGGASWPLCTCSTPSSV